MIYQFKCTNEDCECFIVPTDMNISMAEYDTIVHDLKCPECSSKLHRVYNISGHSTFNDGYKGGN